MDQDSRKFGRGNVFAVGMLIGLLMCVCVFLIVLHLSPNGRESFSRFVGCHQNRIS